MLTAEHSIVINRPIDQVFDYVTDVERMIEWIGPTIATKLTSESPRGVGTTSSRSSQFLGRQIDSETALLRRGPSFRERAGEVLFVRNDQTS